MFHVSKPARHTAPGSCVIIPGRHHDDLGFVDTTTELEGIGGPLRIYLSVTGLRQVAARLPQVGLVPVLDYERALAEADAAREEVQRLQTRLSEYEDQLGRISGLSREGFEVVKARTANRSTTRRT
jgi:hypothetical protein